MAAITSAATGLSNTGATWVGGVVPVEGDTVTIAAGHTVTITGTHIWGNDTATAALTIAGSCVFSTVANTDLTVKGTIVNSGTAAVWRRGTIASPMPAGITSIVKTNYSATLANNKYNISFGATTRFTEWSEVGATRNRQFQVAAAISAGETSITVSDATGWAVGDIIFLESTNTTAAQREHRVLTSVSGNVVGWTTGLTNSRIAGAWGGNLSSNVLWQSFSGSFGAYVQVVCQSTQAAATINMKHIATHGLYGQSEVGGFTIAGTNSVTVANSAVGIVDNLTSCDLLPDGTNAACNVGNAQFGVKFGYAGTWTYPVVYTRLSGFAVYTSSGGTGYFYNAFFSGLNGPIISQFSQGGTGCKIVNSRITNITQLNGGASMIGFSMDNVTLDGAGSILSILQGDYTINNCSFGQVYGISGSTLITNSNNSLSTLTLTNCLFPSGKLIVSPTTYQNALANKPVTLLNKNADPLLQEVYVNTGSIIRDNAQLYRSRSSVKFSPWIGNTPHGYTFNVTGASGLPLTFKFGLRYDTTYGTATPPSVTVSGLGITPQTFTAGGSADTDYAGVITVTPVTNGLLTITISGQTTATLGTGNYWFSGMSVNPWIDWTQWYGYAYLPTLPTLTVDSVVVLSEAAAGALTGISYAASTLTISGTRTISEGYDWLKWYEASNRLAPIITSVDGKNFTASGDVTVSGSLTIPSGSTLATSGAFTLTGSLAGAVTCNVSQALPTGLTGVTINGNLTYNTNTPITVVLTNCIITGTVSNLGSGLVTITKVSTTLDSIGANVTAQQFATITAPNLLSGTRVRLYNVTDSVEMYNSALPGAGLSQSFQWTANKTVTMTAIYASGVTAKLGLTATGIFTESGLTFLDSQENDTVYNTYALSGSSITKFSADYGNDTTDIVLSSDYAAQEFYAWWVYNLTTEQGIREFFGGVTAVDEANIRINASVLDMYLDNETTTNIVQSDNRRFYRDDGVYPVKRPTAGGGGVDVVWRNTILIATNDAANIAAAVHDYTVEDGQSFDEMFRVQHSALAGKVSGANTTTERFRDIADTKDRIVYTVDANGNRTAVTQDGTP